MNWAASIIAILTVVTAARAEPPDNSTPQAAAKSLASAIVRGDADAVRNLIYVEHDPAQQLVTAYANLILAGKKLSEAARQRYPGVSDPFAAGGIAPEDAALIDSATVTVEGEIATLKIQGRERPMKLRRSAGAWKVLVSDEPAAQTPQHLAEQIALVQGLADAMIASATDIAAGKFRDVEDARNAVKDRLGAVAARALQSDPPTSKPTTQGG